MKTKRYINVKKPNSTRSTFSLVWQIEKDNTRSYSVIKNPELDIINSRFLNKAIDLTEAYNLTLDLRKRLLPSIEQKIKYNKANEREILLLTEKIKSDRDIKFSTLKTIELDYRRILALLSEDSILNINVSEIKKRIINSKFSESIQNRLIIYTNKLLKFVGRKDMMNKIEVEIETKYINEIELNILLKHIRESKAEFSHLDQMVTQLLFYTGLRIGELFAFKYNKYNKISSELKIKYQYTEFLSKDETKGKKSRTIMVLKNIKEDYESLFNIKQDEIDHLRKTYSRRLLRYSVECFKDNINKHITAHDLRHSFAMSALSKGINISRIAKILGNGVNVCEKYYTSGELDKEFLLDFQEDFLPKAS